MKISTVIFKMIVSLVEAQEWPQVLRECRDLIEKGSINSHIYFFAGLACWKQGSATRQEAVIYFVKALAGGRLSEMFAAYAHNCLGLDCRRRATAEEGPVDKDLILEAIEHFRSAIALDEIRSHRGVYHKSHASCMSFVGRLEASVNCYAKAIAAGYHKPGDCCYNQGMCLSALGRYEEACKAFRDAVGFDPEHAKAKVWLAKILLKLNGRSSPTDSVSETIEEATGGLSLEELSSPTDSVSETIEETTGGLSLEELSSLTDSLGETIKEAIGGLSTELKSVVESADREQQTQPQRLYFVGPKQCAMLRTEDRLDVLRADLAEAYGVAAMVYTRLGNWVDTEAAVRSGHGHDSDSPQILKALLICGNQREEGGLQLYRRWAAKFGLPTGADGHCPATAGADGGDSVSDEIWVGSPFIYVDEESDNVDDLVDGGLTVFDDRDFESPAFDTPDAGTTATVSLRDPDFAGWDEENGILSRTGSVSSSGIANVAR